MIPIPTVILRGLSIAKIYSIHLLLMIFSGSEGKFSNFYCIAVAANVDPEEGSKLKGTRVVWLPRCAAAAATP